MKKARTVQFIRGYNAILDALPDQPDWQNGYAGFTQNKRGLQKAEDYIKGLAPTVKSRVTMSDIVKLTTTLGLKPHTYCSID